MLEKTRIGVLVSGGGTNLQALIDAQKSGIITSGEIRLVVSSKDDAYALTRAKNNGIKAVAVNRRDCSSLAEFEERILKELKAEGIEMIVLAGFMSILSADFTNAYKNRIINVHPALIPSFCGEGMYGIRPHRAALARGVKVSGATVHFVNENYDEGPILLQKSVDVLPGDTPETLQKRIMQNCEWEILPRAIRLIADGKVVIENNIARITE